MLRFEGDKTFAKPPEEVWNRLTDAQFLVQCVPGVEAVKKAEADEAAWTLRPGLSFVKGTLDVTLRVVDKVPHSSARLLAHSKGIGTSSEVEAAFALSPSGGGTGLHWTAEVKNLGGLLKAVPQGLLQAAAQKVIGDLLTAIETRLAGQGTT